MSAPSRRAVLLGLVAATAGAAASTAVAASAAPSIGSAGPSAASTAPSTATPPRLAMIGDSWAAGLHADPRHALGQVAAARLGWQVEVDGVSGSGYLNTAGAHGPYPDRARRLNGPARVVVVQGGSNDGSWRGGLSGFPDAVAGTIAQLRRRLPNAHLLILGPGPDPWPVSAGQDQVDRLLAAAAAQHGVAYVSMLQRRWITAANLAQVIDPATNHPSIAGHRYLGRRLADAIVGAFPAVV